MNFFDESIGKLNVMPQEIGRVLLNLFNNAFYTTHEQLKKLDTSYELTVTAAPKSGRMQLRLQSKKMA